MARLRFNWKSPGAKLLLNYAPLAFLFVVIAAPQILNQHHHPPQSAAEYAAVLEDPSRDAWQKPHEVVEALGIRPTDVVADIGAGTGYFSRRFAIHAAKVYAVDIDPELLHMVEKNAPPNLVTVLAQRDDPKLPPASVDLIFFCDVLHHLENRPAYYRRLNGVLRPGGRIVTVDFYPKPLPVGPPASMKLIEPTMISEFEEAEFCLSHRDTFLPYQYMLAFTRASESKTGC